MATSDTTHWHGLLPKVETKALEFIDQFPDYDGRGVIVGVLDTGVDPGAIGLQTTSTGLPKVIDIIDCSGSGDVSMSPPISAKDHKLTTADGRVLTINPAWKNPTGLWRIGVKRASELYPRGLKERVLEERKKIFLKKQSEIEFGLQKELVVATGEAIDDIKAKMSLLKSMETNLEDSGPIYDCLTFHDGERWQAVVNTSEIDEQMQLCEPLSDYHVARQYQRFSDLDALNFCVNMYDEGSVLSICVDAGAHGSHVAGIVSCFHDKNPELNGIAPGAQIISFKIGDSRLGSMETGPSLTRAIIEAVKRGCHIINMSYGEGTAWDNRGFFIKLAQDLVVNHDIIFVSSAGNNGPALSTVGAPGGTSSCCIGVGAYINQSMMTIAYQMLENTPDTNYTWSSMGPCIDGDLGVDIIAPGAAVTAVPNWTLQRNQLMNGTSMSSPNACGCIALLLSAAKANKMSVSSAMVRRAVQNSAQLIDGVSVLGQGYGLIQVSPAWHHMQLLAEDRWAGVHYNVTVQGDRFKRGIYLRGDVETCSKDTFKVQIDAIFKDNATVEEKIAYEVRMHLETTADWVKCPPKLLMVKSEKVITVSVDPSKLLPGVHVAFVNVYDEANMERGVLFRVPVTVCKPVVIARGVTDLDLGLLTFDVDSRIRDFIILPPGCTYIDVVVRDARSITDATKDSVDLTPRLLVVHAVQLYSGVAYRDNEKQAYMILSPGSSSNISMAVEASMPLEITFARMWSASLSTACFVSLQFRGVLPLTTYVHLLGGQRVSEQVRLVAQLMTVNIQPSAKLDKWKSVSKPLVAGKVLPLGERDILSDGTPLYQLLLEYSFEQSETSEVVHQWPGLQGVLYESDFHGQFFMIFDNKKKLVFVGDANPKKNKLQKGKYTVRLQVRHEMVSVLERLVDLPMVSNRTLKNDIKVSAYKTKSEALIGQDSGSFGSRSLSIGTSVGIYFKEPAFDTLPKGVKNGDTFTGSITYLKKNGNSSLGADDKPSGHSFTYSVFDSTLDPGKKDETSSEDESEDKLLTVVRNAKLKYIKDLIGGAQFNDAYELLVVEYPDSIQLKVYRIRHYKKLLETAVEGERQLCVAGAKIAIDDVVAMIDVEELAKSYGVLLPLVGKEGDEKKSALVTAYSLQAKLAIEAASGSLESVENALTELKKWADITSDKFWQLTYGKLILEKKWGLALKRVSELMTSSNDGKIIPDTTNEQLLKECLFCLEQLGWEHISIRHKLWLKVAMKNEYDLF